MHDRRQILAMGGGGFTMESTLALDRFALELTGKPVPRICFLPTASGDPREQATRFHERFSSWPCEPSILSLFHLGRDRIDPREHLLAQDVIYVGGGSMRNMLAVWREHSVDEIMRAAWERGIVLAGLSAGAMCWFEGGITMSGGFAARRQRARSGRRQPVGPHGRRARAAAGVPPGDRDRTAAGRFRRRRRRGVAAARDRARAQCVASRGGARVLSIGADGDGGTVERELPVTSLAGALPAPGTTPMRERRVGEGR